MRNQKKTVRSTRATNVRLLRMTLPTNNMSKKTVELYHFAHSRGKRTKTAEIEYTSVELNLLSDRHG